MKFMEDITVNSGVSSKQYAEGATVVAISDRIWAIDVVEGYRWEESLGNLNGQQKQIEF